MHNSFGLFLVLFAAVWLFLATRGIAKELKTSQQAKWIKGTMYLLILIGAAGFFAASFSAMGIMLLKVRNTNMPIAENVLRQRLRFMAHSSTGCT